VALIVLGGSCYRGARGRSPAVPRGKCKPVMMLASPHPGATCEITLAPGERTRIVAKVKPSESLSHWVATGIADDDPDNDLHDPVNVVVKRKRRHR